MFKTLLIKLLLTFTLTMIMNQDGETFFIKLPSSFFIKNIEVKSPEISYVAPSYQDYLKYKVWWIRSHYYDDNNNEREGKQIKLGILHNN